MTLFNGGHVCSRSPTPAFPAHSILSLTQGQVSCAVAHGARAVAFLPDLHSLPSLCGHLQLLKESFTLAKVFSFNQFKK